MRHPLISTGGKGRPKKFEFSKNGQVVVSGYSDHFPIQGRVTIL
jgi:hypothetical protein